MKKLKLITAALCSAIVLQAAQDPFTYHLSGYFGKNMADKSSKMRNDTLYGIRATTMLTSFYGLGIGYERIDKIDIKDSSKTVDLQRIYTEVEVDGEEQYHVVPYITFGVGYEFLSDDVIVEGNKYDVSQAYVSAGLGFRYNFIPELSMMLEANALWKTDTSDLSYNGILGLVYHINATTCDNTYVTQRMKERPQDRNIIHTGSVNNVSGWRKHANITEPSIVTPVKTAIRYKRKIVPVRTLHHNSVIIDAVKTQRKVHKHITKRRHKSVIRKNGEFYIMLGAFKEKKSIHGMVSKLEKKDIAYLLKDNHKKGLTYVVAGAYSNRLAAQKELHKLRKIQKDAYIAKMN